MQKIKKWEVSGAIFSVIAGSLFHFVYGWSGSNKIVAVFGAVNESTWEHLKMAFWPTLLFVLIEYFFLKCITKNFFLATLVKLFSMPILIIGLFYGWQAILPHYVIWDIASFVLAIVIGYILSYKILTSNRRFRLEAVSIILIIAGILKFSLFTYFPPHLFLFEDPVKNTYGIEK